MALRSWTAIATVLLGSACAGNPIESSDAGSVGGSSSGSGSAGASATSASSASSQGSADTTQGTSASTTTSASDVTSASDPTLTSADATAGSSGDSDPGTSNAVEPTTDGGGSSSGNAATSNVSVGSSEGGPACNDTDEPNDAYNAATPLTDIDCNAAATEVANVMDPATGDDWFEFHGDWVCGAPEPIAHVSLIDGAVADICLYPACDAPVLTYYSCMTGQSNAGMGCCTSPGGSTVDMWIDCDNEGDESATVWVEFVNPAAECAPYSFEYSFLPDV